MHMEAVFTIKKVIEKKPANIRYYRKQLKKFEEALNP